MVTDLDVILRLLTITLLSGLIGLEREYNEKPAGVRTNIMVGLGSTLITIASIKAAFLFPDHTVDPTRIAAQIVTGIGFIGAGVILRPSEGSNVVGLTTAASLWVVSGLGIAIGLGLFMEAMVSTLLVLFTFTVVSKGVKVIREKRHSEHHRK